MWCEAVLYRVPGRQVRPSEVMVQLRLLQLLLWLMLLRVQELLRLLLLLEVLQLRVMARQAASRSDARHVPLHT